MLFNVNFGLPLKIDFQIPKIETLKKIIPYRETPRETQSGSLSRLVDAVTTKPGIYFLFKDDILLYIGTAKNIRNRINHHTRKRTLTEIVDQKRINPKLITHVSWLEIEEEVDRQIIETVYLNKYPTAYCYNKVYVEFDEIPERPKDEELENPDVIKYKRCLQKKLAEAVLSQ